jgi:foldase protein PrsA
VKLKVSFILTGLLALQACSNNNGIGSKPQPGTVFPQRDSGAAPDVSKTASDSIAPQPIVKADSGDQVVAMVRGGAITRANLEPVLEAGYGLNVLLTLVQRELVHQEAEKMHVVVTPQDIADERQLTLVALKKATQTVDPNTGATSQPSDNDISPEEAAQLLNRILEENRVSQAEFNVVVEINAYLRKVAQPQVNAQITDAAVQKHFNAMYGEKVSVHYIVCDNMLDAAQARRDLATGIAFDDVARTRSKDWQTAPSGGALPPFTMQDNRFPDEFKQVAFLLKPGEISDDVQIGKFVYIVKSVERFPPQYARFEDYRETARKDLYDQAVQAAITLLRQNLGKMALESMHIQDPVLKAQWEQRLAKIGDAHDKAAVQHQMNEDHNLTIPTTQPLEQYLTGGTAPHATTRLDPYSASPSSGDGGLRLTTEGKAPQSDPANAAGGAAPPATMPATPPAGR